MEVSQIRGPTPTLDEFQALRNCEIVKLLWRWSSEAFQMIPQMPRSGSLKEALRLGEEGSVVARLAG